MLRLKKKYGYRRDLVPRPVIDTMEDANIGPGPGQPNQPFRRSAYLQKAGVLTDFLRLR
jgi:hypothetical protein